MSLDLASYWQPATLTPMGLLQYWPQEIALYTSTPSAIDLEFGDTKSTPQQEKGELIVTTHRVVWRQSMKSSAAASPSAASSSATSSTPVIYLHLEAVDRIELKSSLLAFGFATPRIILHLHDPPMIAYLKSQYPVAGSPLLPSLSLSLSSSLPPVKSSLPRFVRLVFRGEAPAPCMKELQSALNAGVWKHQPLASSSSSASAAASPSSAASAAAAASFSTTNAGISGIVREVRGRERAIDRTLEQAFTDLDALMRNAKSIVDLANKLSTKELDSSKAKDEYDSVLTSIGILNPVVQGRLPTNEYHIALAREMCDYLPQHIKKSGGMLLLTDAYCLMNRARGTQLISPQDCLTSAEYFSSLTPQTKMRLYEFPTSHVKVILEDAEILHQVSKRILQVFEADEKVKQQQQQSYDIYRDAVSISPLQLSNRWHISIILAKQFLCLAEQEAALCRDESIHGLTFFRNLFTAASQAHFLHLSHFESWNPLWSVASILNGLLSFMLETTPTAGSTETSDSMKREYAKRSMDENKKNVIFRKLFPQYLEENNGGGGGGGQQQEEEEKDEEKESKENRNASSTSTHDRIGSSSVAAAPPPPVLPLAASSSSIEQRRVLGDDDTTTSSVSTCTAGLLLRNVFELDIQLQVVISMNRVVSTSAEQHSI